MQLHYIYIYVIKADVNVIINAYYCLIQYKHKVIQYSAG